MNAYIERVLEATKKKNASEPEFLQTVEEVFSSLEPVINAHPEYEKVAKSACKHAIFLATRVNQKRVIVPRFKIL